MDGWAVTDNKRVGEFLMDAIVWSKMQDSLVQRVSEGIRVRPLWQGETGKQAVVVELDPGAIWEGVDVHTDSAEEVYVLSGTFNDGIRDYAAGTFIHHPIGSSHIPQSKTGCTLFIFYPGK
jgi:anti-sigma factor ChrR (cupin superfamily)